MRNALLAVALVSVFATSAFARSPFAARGRSYRSPYRVDSTFSQTPYGYARSTTFSNPFGSTTLNYGIQPRQQLYINRSFGGYVNPYGSSSGFNANPWGYGGFGGGY